MSDLPQIVPPPSSSTESNDLITTTADHAPTMDALHTTTASASATAAPDSERTNSSSITSGQSNSSDKNNSNHENKNNSSNETTTPHNNNHNSGQVSFGSVHVHEHRMTLGSNPEVTHGVPVELAWTEEESDLFDTIDDFEQRNSNSNINQDDAHNGSTTIQSSSLTTTTHDASSSYPHAVHRLKASDRDEIASLHHSRDSIVRVKQQVQQIQEQRHVSKRDPEPMKIINDIRRQRMNRDTGDTTTATSPQPRRKSSHGWCCCPFV